MNLITKACLGASMVLALGACAHQGNVAETAEGTSAFPILQRTPANDTGIDAYTIAEGQSRQLENCKGVATLSRDYSGKLYLKIRGSRCATLVTNDINQSKLTGPNNQKAVDVLVVEDYQRTAKVEVRSESGKNADIFYIRVMPHQSPSSPMVTLNLNWTGDSGERRLPNCGGTVEAKINNGQLNITFRGLSSCNMFDIVSNSGSSLSYDNKPLQQQGGGFGAGFTIPKHVIQVGANSLILKAYALGLPYQHGNKDQIMIRVVGAPAVW